MINFLISTVAFIFSLLFAVAVLRRWSRKRSPHLLLWGIGLVLYGVGALAQAYLSGFTWQPGDGLHELAYRVWYLTGAILTSAWLGQGSVYLLTPRRFANAAMIVLAVASAAATVVLFTTSFAEPNYSTMISSVNNGGLLTGKGIITSGPIFSIPFNIYGTVALGGGALWSAYQFWRKQIMANRMVGNLFIAIGAFFPAIGGTLNNFKLEGFLYLGIAVGAVLMYVGFQLASAPQPAPAPAKVTDATVKVRA